MPTIPGSTKTSLAQRLRRHATEHRPQLTGRHIRYRGQFACVEGELADRTRLPLIRLRYGGSASVWDLAATSPAAASILPTGFTTGGPQQALDCACDLCLGR